LTARRETDKKWAKDNIAVARSEKCQTAEVIGKKKTEQRRASVKTWGGVLGRVSVCGGAGWDRVYIITRIKKKTKQDGCGRTGKHPVVAGGNMTIRGVFTLRVITEETRVSGVELKTGAVHR